MEIAHDNAIARLQGDPQIIREVRPLIAYREQDLPPVGVQGIIKAFMKACRAAKPPVPRQGTDRDIWALYQSVFASRLADLDWPIERMIGREFEAALRLPGIWDGWTTLVSPGGYFGAGLVPHVARALRLRLGIEPTIRDTRTRPAYNPIMGYGHPDLYPFQKEAVQAWCRVDRGVVNLPPRSGKTHIAISIVMRLGLPALVVVPTVNLIEQTVERFSEYLPKNQVMGVSGGRPNAKKQRMLNHALVWVATPATAAGPKPKKKTARRPGMSGILSRRVLVIDEFHHSAADTWQDISRAATAAYYRLGLTGTHYRADGKDLRMHAVLSHCVYRKSVNEMVALGRLVPAKVAMVRVQVPIGDVRGHDLYTQGIVDHEYRNQLIAIAANWLVHLGKRVLVLTKEVVHAEDIARRIDGAIQLDRRHNDIVQARLKELGAGTIRCIVGTPVIGEGVDVPAADALVYAAGGKSRVKVVQDYFRVLTASGGKTHGIVVDMADVHHSKLEEAAAHRLALYRSQEAFTSEVIDPMALPEWLQRAVGAHAL